ncbi:hypothetical protein DL770_001957 [Monosporascus sp. CRB-9-2]|nr:hypothetical protein DL770_001957 [Monosporascus sp. CRB-9-2]
MDPSHHPHLTTDLPHFSSNPGHRSTNSTPISSPGLFSPNSLRSTNPLGAQPHSESSTPAPAANSPYLHPLQTHRVRETHKALVDLDYVTGRKIINQYEVIEELGRGMHGKVKLARNLETGENVAIKIIPRFSKKRRLGKVTASPQDKTKREIAILKKIRHPNVVALLEIIDDPELKKIYMVLEHVELGEVVWRKKGLPSICAIERRRVEREMRGEQPNVDEDTEHYQYLQLREKRQAIRDMKRAKMQQTQRGPEDFWSIEYGAANEDDVESQPHSYRRNAEDAFNVTARHTPISGSSAHSRAPSQVPSRAQSIRSALSRASTPLPSEPDIASVDFEPNSELKRSGTSSLSLSQQRGPSAALEGTMYGAYSDEGMFRGRSPSMADSIISHMSSVDYNPQPHDPFADDYSYVPCFTIEEARATFRDTVLGLEYLHYEGVVHRDIKPANLLWTRDHRVKISDFGVSYFGRPIREGEPDELVSESEARDFDNDLELAKTVGTPAFFAPELCYTDVDGEQPKISEQIDVWSLGVTLYCLIFARIPFMAEDEFQMFKKIAKEDVYIPRRRLKPVDPHYSPSSTDFHKRVSKEPYRDDAELAYEDIDDSLYELLHRMLTKNPDKRIRLREIKRHRWVLQDIPDPIPWLDDTDPSNRTAGRKIEVDEREITRAVVPLTFLERARSVVKKAVDRVMHARSDKADGSRRRATSSAASSVGDALPSVSATPHYRDVRRKSIRPDDYFATVIKEPEHPLAQSVTASPEETPTEAGGQQAPSHPSIPALATDLKRRPSVFVNDSDATPDWAGRPPSRSSLSSGKSVGTRHGRTKSITNAILAISPSVFRGPHTTPVTPALDTVRKDDPMATLRKARDLRSIDDSSRSQSVDRGLFANQDKRAEAKVAVSTAIAPGSVELPKRPLSVRPPDATTPYDDLPSSPPDFFFPRAVRPYQNRQPSSDPNIYERQLAAVDLSQRPMTAHRIIQMEGVTPPPRVYNSSSAESFARAQEQMLRRQRQEVEEVERRRQEAASRNRDLDPIQVPCPPSPDDEQPPPSRGNTVGTATSSSASLGTMMTPLTSPSEVASPVCITDLGGRHDSQIFRSDPSLPALLSGASSVSADPEGEFLLKPGYIDRPSLIDTTDSLTPPALTKEPIAGFPLDELESDAVLLSHHHDRPSSSPFSSRAAEDENASDSDEGLVMARSKKKGQMGKTLASTRRRDTQTSVGSTDTAKKVLMQSS